MGLKRVCSVRNTGPSEKIEANVISYFDYEFLDNGAYFNVPINSTGDYQSNLSLLAKVNDPRGFTYWAGPKNWVYENGADNSGVFTPAQIYVNGSGYSLGSINYRDGYVYNVPINATGVKAQFSYKWISFVSARKTGIGRKINTNTVQYSGVNPEIELAVPIVSVDVSPINKVTNYGLSADRIKKLEYDVKFTVISTSDTDVKRISDILVNQKDSYISSFDPDLVKNSGDFPLTKNGLLNSGKSHAELVGLYPWNSIYILDASAKYSNYVGDNISQAIVTMKIETPNCGCG